MKVSNSNSFQDKYNVNFPTIREVKTLSDLLQVASSDHTEATLRGTLNTDNFISADCVIMDIDNSGMDSEHFMTPETFKEKFFTDVEFFVVFSRNHNKVKKGESARPRFHVYFPLSEEFISADKLKTFREELCLYCPYFDKSVKGAARKIFGVENPTGLYFEGSERIDTFMARQEVRAVAENVEKAKKAEKRPCADKDGKTKKTAYVSKSQIKSIEALKESLPKRPGYSDTYRSRKGKFTNREAALSARYIQLNRPNKVKFLVFKIPVEDILDVLDGEGRSCPVLPLCCLASRHSRERAIYLVYVLNSPVYTASAEHVKPLQYLNAIIDSFSRELGAKDYFYDGLMPNIWNSEAWFITYCGRAQYEYSLKCLAEAVNLPPQKKILHSLKPREEIIGLGRNSAIFENVRLWAYRERRKYWSEASEKWLDAVLLKCREENKAFNPPLPDNEVRDIARSIAKWTQAHITPEGFSEFARREINRRWSKESQKSTGIEMLKIGFSDKEVMQELGVSRQSVFNWRKEVGIIRQAEKKEWEKKGISRATWYRKKDAEVNQSDVNENESERAKSLKADTDKKHVKKTIVNKNQTDKTQSLSDFTRLRQNVKILYQIRAP